MNLSDDDLALIFEGKAQKLRDGEKSREELRDELYELLVGMDGVIEKRGSLQSQGRVSFGRSRQGQVGRALFIPDEDDDDGPPLKPGRGHS